MRNTKISQSHQNMSLHFYERFKDRMASISKHGIQELLPNKPLIKAIDHRAQILPPITVRHKPPSQSTIKPVILERQNSAHYRKLQLKSDHKPPSSKFKKQQSSVLGNCGNVATPSTQADRQPRNEQTGPGRAHTSVHSILSKSSLRLSIPDDLDFKTHLRKLEAMQSRKLLADQHSGQ